MACSKKFRRNTNNKTYHTQLLNQKIVRISGKNFFLPLQKLILQAFRLATTWAALRMLICVVLYHEKEIITSVCRLFPLSYSHLKRAGFIFFPEKPKITIKL